MFETHQARGLRKPSWSHAGDLDHVMTKVGPSMRVLSTIKDTKNRSVSIHVKHHTGPELTRHSGIDPTVEDSDSCSNLIA